MIRLNLLRMREAVSAPGEIVVTNPAVMELPRKGDRVYLHGSEHDEPLKYEVVNVIHHVIGRMTPGYVTYDGQDGSVDVLLRRLT